MHFGDAKPSGEKRFHCERRIKLGIHDRDSSGPNESQGASRAASDIDYPSFEAGLAGRFSFLGGRALLAGVAAIAGVSMALASLAPREPTDPMVGSPRIIALAPASVVPDLPEETTQTLILDPDNLESEASPVAADVIRSVTIGEGDTLMDIVVAAGADRRQAYAAVQSLSRLYNPKRLQHGQEIAVTLSPGEDGELFLRKVSLRSEVDRFVNAEIQEDGQFQASEERLAMVPSPMFFEGTITDSLFLSARRAGIPTAILVDVIRIFSFDVDFQREIRSGDRFEVYFNRYHDDSGKVSKDGEVLYASLTLRGKQLPLYRYAPSDGGRTDYFNDSGHSARKSLMRTPIDGARLTSRYGLRKHPILGYSRMHRGVDFGANRGTPIMAAGDGVVERSSRYGSYGNYIRLRHNGQYSTAYGHLKSYGRGIKKGRRVKQGQIIGYVGSTGGATGPHLHYEVLVNGKQSNPLALKLPTGRKLQGAELETFKRLIDGVRASVDTIAERGFLMANPCPQTPDSTGVCDTVWPLGVAL